MDIAPGAPPPAPAPPVPTAATGDAPAGPGDEHAGGRASLVGLILANLVPLVGVLWWHWDAATLVLLYWIENLVVGFYGILRIVLARVKSVQAVLGKLFLAAFFCIHFGGFCAAHGLFLVLLFKIGGGQPAPEPSTAWPGPLVLLQMFVNVITTLWRSRPPGMEWPVLALVASHGVSFVQNHLRRGEIDLLKDRDLMTRPYQRIVLLHVTIVLGAMPAMALGSPVPLLCILVVLKTAVDVYLHRRAHRRVHRGVRGRQPARAQP